MNRLRIKNDICLKKNKLLICKNYLLLFSLFAILSCNKKRQQNEAAKILFEKTDFDFGEIPADENISIVFPFSNSSDSPLLIKNIKSSCGCTVPLWNKEKIMPAGIDEIKVKINPSYRGKFSSIILVYYNGKNSPQKLTIKGEVEYLSLLD